MPAIDYFNPYAYLMRARRALYERGALKSEHPGIPVISIGNLTLGGTGKSPLVVNVANYLHERHGKRVAVVSRGYRRRSKGFVLVRDGGEILVPVEDSGDEARMLAEMLPDAIIIVDENRVHGARAAKNLGAEVIMLDDGYQHLRLRRNLNILLFDASQRTQNVIPFGRLREPVAAIHAADVALLTNASEEKETIPEKMDRFVRPDAVRASLRAVPRSLEPIGDSHAITMDTLKGKRVFAVSSIASPRRFHDMLRTLGVEVISRDLGDHANYSESIVKCILRDVTKAGADAIITTAKDAVKSRRYFEAMMISIPAYILHQDLEFLQGEDRFYVAIDDTL